MARVILADDGIVFDGRTPEQGPLGQLLEQGSIAGPKLRPTSRCD